MKIAVFRFQIQSLLDEAQLAVSKGDVLQTKRQASKEFRDKQLQEVMAMHHKQLTVATERKGAMEAELKNIIEQNGNLVESLDQMRAREQELKSKGREKFLALIFQNAFKLIRKSSNLAKRKRSLPILK